MCKLKLFYIMVKWRSEYSYNLTLEQKLLLSWIKTDQTPFLPVSNYLVISPFFKDNFSFPVFYKYFEYVGLWVSCDLIIKVLQRQWS